MNTRIFELEKQATETVKCGLNGTHTADSFNRKKFAELLIKECAYIVENSPWVLNRGYKATDQASLVKQHFGVEE